MRENNTSGKLAVCDYVGVIHELLRHCILALVDERLEMAVGLVIRHVQLQLIAHV